MSALSKVGALAQAGPNFDRKGPLRLRKPFGGLYFDRNFEKGTLLPTHLILRVRDFQRKHPIFIFVFMFSGNIFRSKIFRFPEQYGVDSRAARAAGARGRGPHQGGRVRAARAAPRAVHGAFAA